MNKFESYLAGKLLRYRHGRWWMPDRWYIEKYWEREFGTSLNLERPQTYCEKMNWIKLYDRNPIYTIMADKYLVKQFVADKIGSKYIIPTLAVYKSVDEIDLDKLPNQFVLKCNHDSGSTIVCTDKSTFDLVQAKEKLKKRWRYSIFISLVNGHIKIYPIKLSLNNT